MSARRFLAAALLVGLSAAAANADEPPTRIFHIGIVAGSPRSSDERVAFEIPTRWQRATSPVFRIRAATSPGWSFNNSS